VLALRSIVEGRAVPPTPNDVDATVTLFVGRVGLQSASGPLESVWMRLLPSHGYPIPMTRGGQDLAVVGRLTPDDARALAAALNAYADTHAETET
jgi:hypothetical protein